MKREVRLVGLGLNVTANLHQFRDSLDTADTATHFLTLLYTFSDSYIYRRQALIHTNLLGADRKGRSYWFG